MESACFPSLGIDQFTDHYHSILDGVYDCVDRIVINAFFINGYIAGGFRNWWRVLHGSDDNLDTNTLMRFAGRFSRRIHAYCKSESIPLIKCSGAERKDIVSRDYIPDDPTFSGIFLIIVSKSRSVIWDVERYGNGGLNLKKKEPMPFVNHYSFHIIDKEWGHVTIFMSGHPPFGAKVILNGHEWVERQAIREKISIEKDGNCFTSFSNGQALSRVAETLPKGRLHRVCDRWIYNCLWFGLDYDEQGKSGFKYSYSTYQAEYSRNLLFDKGIHLDQVFQNTIDLTRRHLDLDVLKTIFGYKHRPKKRNNKPRLEMSIERPVYNMTVFKIHFGKITVKIYDKGERVLRIEVIVHNAKELKCKRSLEHFTEIIVILGNILLNFLNVLKHAHVSFLDDGLYDNLSKPAMRGKNRLAGIDINRPRNLTVMNSILALSLQPGGFTSKDISIKVRERLSLSESEYTSRQASYDLKKFRGKNIIERIDNSRKYQSTFSGIQLLHAILIIRDRLFKPLISGVLKEEIHNDPKEICMTDRRYKIIRDEIFSLCQEHGLNIAA
jgi:hypothetical protein